MSLSIAPPSVVGTLPAVPDVRRLDVRQWSLLAAGVVLVASVLPPFHLMLFVANALFAFWLGRQPWDWLRRYGCFFLIETIYLWARVAFPRPPPLEHAVARFIFPPGDYFLFLWFSVEIVVYLRLLDFVLSGHTARTASWHEFLLFFFYPFFLAGPAIGFDEFRRAYRTSPTATADLVYGLRKCLWGGMQLFVLGIWLHGAVVALRALVTSAAPMTEVVDTRLLMWTWIAGMSVLMGFVHKGYTDLMLGLSRLAGYRFQEQVWFPLFAKNPIEYWQNNNRAVYRMTSLHIFGPFFERSRILPKTMLATLASGAFHAFICPQPTLAAALLLSGLAGVNGIAVALTYRLRWMGETAAVRWLDDGPGHNALIVGGVVATFALTAFSRSGFLLMVEGLTVGEWFGLIRLLFVQV